MALNLAAFAKVVKPLTTRFPKYDAPVSPTGQLKTPPTCTSSLPHPRPPSGFSLPDLPGSPELPPPVPIRGFPPVPLWHSASAQPKLQCPPGHHAPGGAVTPVAPAQKCHGRPGAQCVLLNASRESDWEPRLETNQNRVRIWSTSGQSQVRIPSESWRSTLPDRFRDYGGEAC